MIQLVNVAKIKEGDMGGGGNQKKKKGNFGGKGKKISGTLKKGF